MWHITVNMQQCVVQSEDDTYSRSEAVRESLTVFAYPLFFYITRH